MGLEPRPESRTLVRPGRSYALMPGDSPQIIESTREGLVDLGEGVRVLRVDQSCSLNADGEESTGP